MKSSSRLLDRRLGYSLASLGMLLGVVTPSLVPAFASATVLSSRSVQMSDSTISATGVKYTVSFTPDAAFQNLVLDFCANSPVIGDDCDVPAGLSLSGATLTSNSALGTTALDSGSLAANHAEITGTAGSSTGSALTFELNNVTNPSAVGTFYARIYTYGATQDYTDASTLGTVKDSGGVAMSTTNSIGVSAAVRESLTFCVSDEAHTPTANCAGASNPSLVLGEDTGDGSKALSSTAVSKAKDIAQLSTNAVNGAVVWMKSNRTCGGLARNEAATTCNIAPQNGTPGIAMGNALFGVKVGASSNGDAGATGNLSPIGSGDDAKYATDYYMNYHSDNSEGVTSPYGSQLFNSGGTLVSNKNIELEFAASAANDTPAGLYRANLSLIATGSF